MTINSRLANGDPRIKFKGFAPAPVAAMAAVDIVAMPSRWEAYGLVAIEALAAKRNLLVSSIGGLKDHLEKGAQAVQPGGDIESWQQAIEQATAACPSEANVQARPIKRPEDTYAAA
ncbi:glycosyltransferase [Sulfitobacter sp. 1A13368]|uniref:glycosyltransferase n=1 Tax=Sulfitobacter sp. 1A13368 TaxID=3368593 RepID=UPI003744E41C